MREEDLARALAEYLRRERLNNEINLKKIEKNNLYYDNLILNNEILNINKEYDYKVDKNRRIYDETNDEIRIPSQIIYYDSTAEEIERAKIKFMQDDTQVLNGSSPSYLREDVGVIITSITRNINSIDYSWNHSNEVQQVAILEAKKQGYAFNHNTPQFMLDNPELIRLSIAKDINTINFIPNYAITDELVLYAKELALKNNYVLSNDSPSFFKKDIEIIKQSLRLNKNINDYVIWYLLTPEQFTDIENYIIDNHLDYIITYKSPFKSNPDICIISAKNDLGSVNYFNWESLLENKEAGERVVDTLIEQNYVLSNNSHYKLKEIPKLCLSSIKNDIHSARYFSKAIHYLLATDLEELGNIKDQLGNDCREMIYEIRHYLIQNGFYSLEQIAKFKVPLLKDEVLLDYYLKQLGMPKDAEDEEVKLFYDRVKDFLKTTLSTPVSVTDTRKVFHMIGEKKWEDYRRENNDYYTNIFNRICDSLEKNNNFISALNELKFLIKIDDVLDERKYDLFNAFIEYHQLYHSSNAENKMELLQAKRDDISKNAALFISKSKEDFISEQMALFDEKYKQFFTIRVDNPIIRKKVVEIKQRDMLKKLFNSHDESLMQKLDIIKNKYLAYNYNAAISKDIIPQIIEQFISQLITNNVSSVDDILAGSKPARFDEYENYEKVVKLINRLNSHNISYDGQEVNKYRDFIIFDGQKYVYNGIEFNDNELVQIMGYKDLKYVFSKVRSEIIQIAKGIDKFDKLTGEDIKSVIGECPFTDEYYEFNPDIYKRFYLTFIDSFVQAFDDNKDVILNDTNYQALQQLVHVNGLIHISAMTKLGYYDSYDERFFDMKEYVWDKKVATVIFNIPSLINLLTPAKINIDNLDKLLDFKDMFEYADLKQISLLGKEVIKKIYSNNGFTSSSQSERINVACDLLTAMVSRKESTVPYINGTYRTYKYSIYDSTDETLLTAGLDTNACFRCCGNDNDFLHYCALNKNGFVIKLTDSEGNFIGRAAGFRNGNGVYINQLRTIYDKKSSAYSSERDAIIKTFEQACNDIVETSQKNQNEKNKIDFVVVTKSYTLDDINSNVDNRTYKAIGKNPMDATSEDWKQFVGNTKNLREAARNNYFTTDYGNYSLICMKSAVGELSPDKIKKGDVPALYMRARKQISIDEPGEKIETTVNRIRAMYSHQSGKEFEYIKIPQECKIVNGDNWYAILGKQGIIDSCYLPNDEFAQQEFNSIMKQLLANKQPTEEVIEDSLVPKAKK